MNQPTNENLKLALDLMARTALDDQWRAGLIFPSLQSWAYQVGQVCDHALRHIEELENENTTLKMHNEAREILNREPRYTTGHCLEKAKPDGCQLHNLFCGYPDCDRKLVDK